MGDGTVRQIGILILCFDYNVPYKVFGINCRSFANKNLKNAELFPGLYNVSYLSVVNSSEASSKLNFS